MIEFTVYGRARTKGSTRSFVKNGKVITRDASGNEGLIWEQNVASAAFVAREQAGGRIAPHQPVAVDVTFYVPRNKGDWGTGRNAHKLRPSAPRYPATRPDVDKFLRRALDALTGILYADDGQVVEVLARKRWGDPPRAEVKVWVLGEQAEDGQLSFRPDEQLALTG